MTNLSQSVVLDTPLKDCFSALKLPGGARVERCGVQEGPELSGQSVIFSASSGGLSERICRALGATPGKLVLDRFANTETRIEIHESVRDRHAFVLASATAPVNEAVMQTVLLVQALKLADARCITVVLPCFPYARQDRKADTRPPISAKAVTDILKAVGAHRIVTVDLHATQVEGFFDGPFETLCGLNQIVAPVIAEEGDDLVVVSPDAGGAKRAEKFSRQAEKISGKYAPLVVMSKFRPGPNVPPQVTLSVGQEFLQGKTCVLVDDIVDTGGSIIAAAQALKDRGVRRVVVCAAHAPFSNNALQRLANARTAEGEPAIDRIYVTDSLPVRPTECGFLRVVSIAPLLAEAIRRLDRPMGTLRELSDRTDLGVLLKPPGSGSCGAVAIVEKN